MERSYNAFPVRMVTDEDGERRVVPAGETSEGDSCIEMRIRIDPDGAMSSLLMQLVKVHGGLGSFWRREERVGG